ncbi:hypothetical protein BH23VER1_BH23VER1_23700 [soil metagenome]
MYPGSLDSIIDLFQTVQEEDRRSLLISYAENASKH